MLLEELAWVSSPSVEKVLFPLHYFVVSECREVVNDWMLSDRRLDLYECILSGRLSFFSLPLFLLSFSLLSPLFFLLLFAQAFISFPSRLDRTSERTCMLLHYLRALSLYCVHVHEFILEDIHKRIPKARDYICQTFFPHSKRGPTACRD